MKRLRPDVDIIKEVLEQVIAARPDAVFCQSLYRQYLERGGLSRKQLEGLYGKASRIKTISPARLATLEAIILRKPVKEKSAPPPPAPLYTRDPETGRLIEMILQKFPQHKRVLFFKTRYEQDHPLSSAELTELHRFAKLARP